jgi:hypothetical protein
VKKRFPYSHILALDDGHFPREHKGNVLVVGIITSYQKVQGVSHFSIRKDGNNATSKVIQFLEKSRFRPQIQLILMKGIAFGGFNVVNIQKIYQTTGIPVLVIARKKPNLKSIEEALLMHVSGGLAKWNIIEKTGAMEQCGRLYIQRSGISSEESLLVIKNLTLEGHIPEPLRLAHLVAQGMTKGESRGRA